jgi:lipid-A-disaccharide synthase-like uncharacterized protein
MEILGWAGTMLVVAAYYPQIRHLWVEKCAWGISIVTWVIWLIAGTLLLVYSLLRQDALFVVVQSINIVAIAITIILARRSDQICPYHLMTAQERDGGCEEDSDVVQPRMRNA